MTIYSSTNIENSGSFKATDVTLFSGADLTYTGHYGTASATTVAASGAASGFNVNNMTCMKGSSWTINGNDAIVNAQSLTFEQGASLTINADVSAENQSTPIIGGRIDKLTMKGNVTLNFSAVNNLQPGSYKIFNATDEEWIPENITLTGWMQS